MSYRFYVLLLLWIPLSGNAGQPVLQFSLPLDCQIGKQCFVQNFYDHDPSSGYVDYHCGSLTYDGHKGIDIRLPNIAAMSAGVAVLAAADGKVRAIRDGMEDVSIRNINADSIRKREAGNSVIIDHGNGWVTQYAHMRKNSVSVRSGQIVKRGQTLGLLGLSGNTEFPHLHFEVRHNNQSIDPFMDQAEPGKNCNAEPEQPGLWDTTASTQLKYVPSGVLATGFSSRPPSQAEIMQDSAKAISADVAQPVLLFWVNTFGMLGGDREQIRLIAPDGRVIAENAATIPSNKAVWLSYAGLRNKTGKWATGSYRGEYKLTRMVNGKPLEVLSTSSNLLFESH